MKGILLFVVVVVETQREEDSLVTKMFHLSCYW